MEPSSVDVARQQARDRFVAEAERWTERNGSERLRKALALGLLDRSLGVYRDERLAAERPGWVRIEDRPARGVRWIEREIVNPSLAALNLLELARATVGDGARLVWLEQHQYPEIVWRGAAVVAGFLDVPIALGDGLVCGAP